MDPRRPTRVIDPIVRHVGFFAPRGSPPPPDRTQSGPQPSASPSSTPISPVMIPLARHASDHLTSLQNQHPRSAAVPVSAPVSTGRRAVVDTGVVGSYNESDSVLASSPSAASPSYRLMDGEFSEDSVNWVRRSNEGTVPAGFNSAPEKAQQLPVDSGIQGASNELPSNLKPTKVTLTKAERRALQESQRAKKAVSKGEGKKATASGGAFPVREQSSKNAKQPSQKRDGAPGPSSAIALEKKGGDRLPDKDRKKDAPPPRMQFDDKSRVDKAKRHAVVKRTEARNRVELFRHLPQYEHGTQLPDLEAKFFQLDQMHPAVYKVGLQYLAGDISSGNARCTTMLQAFREAIKDYCTPPEKTLTRDLTAKINSYVSFLIECRPLSISMGNAIRFLKARIAKLPLDISDFEAKNNLCSDIDRFIGEKIVLADKVIVAHAFTKIRDGDVLLTYGWSTVVEMIFSHAHELGKRFRVVVVDSRPKLEGKALLRKLVGMGISCTYTHINAVSYIMHEVTRVFLGAASVLSNGTVYSRVGTACVAMVANAFRVPVLVCCEAYKFHERVQLDSICANELGDPHVIAKVPGRTDVDYLGSWTDKENLQLLNLLYDVTPSDYVSMIITDYGMIPPTSVPVIVREYGKEHILI